MIHERHMKQAKRLDNGEIIVGYLWRNKGYYMSNDMYDLVEVDPATVEDVAVKPTPKEYYPNGTRSGFCPNCKEALLNDVNYCPPCGQRIDWR